MTTLRHGRAAEGSALRGGKLGVASEIGSRLGLKLKGLGAQVDDVDALLQAVKRRFSVAAQDNVMDEAHARQVSILPAGTTCSYKRKEDGARSILSFQHPGDFCDLHRYILADPAPAMGVQALTDCTVAVIDYVDMDRLLLRPTLASAVWRASMLEAAAYRERLSSIGRGTAIQRVAHFPCEQLALRAAVGIGAPQLPFSQIDVADAAGLSVVHVNRTIQTLRTLNVLSKARHALEVVNRKELEKIARFEDHYLGMPNSVSEYRIGSGRGEPSPVPSANRAAGGSNRRQPRSALTGS
jgi:CRP-like cAMP-binding protein